MWNTLARTSARTLAGGFYALERGGVGGDLALLPSRIACAGAAVLVQTERVRGGRERGGGWGGRGRGTWMEIAGRGRDGWLYNGYDS